MKSSMCVQEKAVLLHLEWTWVSSFPAVSKHTKNLQDNAPSWLGAEPRSKGQATFMPAGMKIWLCVPLEDSYRNLMEVIICPTVRALRSQ